MKPARRPERSRQSGIANTSDLPLGLVFDSLRASLQGSFSLQILDCSGLDYRHLEQGILSRASLTEAS